MAETATAPTTNTTAAPEGPTLTPARQQSVDALSATSGAPVTAAADADTGLVTALVAADGHALAPANGGPVASATSFVESQSGEFGLAGSNLTSIDTSATLGGGTSVRLAQEIDGVPVLGGEVAVILDEANRPTAVISDLTPVTNVETTPRITAAQARETAHTDAESRTGQAVAAAAPELAIYNPAVLGDGGLPFDHLVWKIEITDEAGLLNDLVLVDAHAGTIQLRIDQRSGARERSVCDNNNVRSSYEYCYSTPARVEGDPPTGVADVDKAYDRIGDVYNFFYDRFGYDSLDGAGGSLEATARFCPPINSCPSSVAMWTGERMVLGAGYANADDVIAHELTHGYTDHLSNLFGVNESKAIDEALSDIFGEFVDLTNGTGNDAVSQRWYIGEDFPGGAYYRLSNPTPYFGPDRMTSPLWIDGGPYGWKGVANKAAFLMTDGGTFNGVTVTGLGLDKAAAIWFNTNASLLTSAADYGDLDLALVASCHDLIGVEGITPADCTEVSDATDAVEMHLRPPLPGEVSEAPVCPPGQQAANLFADDFEHIYSGNWVIQSMTGTTHWEYPASDYWGAPYATSGVESVAGVAEDGPGDSAFAMTDDVALPVGVSAHLWFARAFDFDDVSDGMMLEYSTNGGGTWTDAAPLITDNGYTGTINRVDNPLNGRPAFTDTSLGYASTRADLSSLGGTAARFRFRIGTAGNAQHDGAFIDDVRIYTCAPVTDLVVNTALDTVDVAPGDGVCADATNACSLRAAIQEANALAGPNTVILPTNARIDLTRAGTNEDLGATGDLDVVGSALTIKGNNAIINAAGLDRVLQAFGQPLILEHLTLAGGNTSSVGGGLLATDSATLTDVAVSGNHAQQIGGGILVLGDLAMTASHVAGNTSGRGAGVAALGAVALDGTVVEANTAADRFGGIVVVGAGPVTIDDSTINGNQAANWAGGMYLESPFTISGSTISNNSTSGIGGGLLAAGSGTITRTSVIGNDALQGGGVAAFGDLAVTASTVSHNNASGAAGIGAVGPTLTIANSTVSGNDAGAFPGGGVLHSSILTLDSSTITANSAASGAGIYTLGVGEMGASGGTSTATNSIIANQIAGPDCSGTGPINSGGFNISSSATCALTAPTDQETTDPAIGPLGGHGGPTETHLPMPGSPAIDNGSPTCPTTDQRGIGRPQGGVCDTGAVETYSGVPDLYLEVNSTVDAIDADLSDLVCETTAGECTLRAAIMTANSANSHQTIQLQPDVTYTLDRPGINEDQARTGDLDLTTDIHLLGANATIDAGGLDRAFQLHYLVDASMENLTITNGEADDYFIGNGGGIRARTGTTLALDNVTVAGNIAYRGGGIYTEGSIDMHGGGLEDNTTIPYGLSASEGGGLWAAGPADLDSVTVTGNEATNGAGLYLGGDGSTLQGPSVIQGNVGLSGGPVSRGGGIYNAGTLTIADPVLIDGNQAERGGGIENGGDLTVDHATISNNTAREMGGGIANTGTATIDGATISSNTATTAGATQRRGGGFANDFGDLTVTGASEIRGNSVGSGAGGTGYGGAGWSTGGTLVVEATLIVDNTAGPGAALGSGGGLSFASGTAIVRDSTITGSIGDYGGAIQTQSLAHLSVERTTLNANTATVVGGGIYNTGEVTLDDATLSGNNAPWGGGAYIAGAFMLIDATVTANTAGAGGGLFTLAGRTITIGNSIVSANAAGGDCGGAGTWVSQGYNYRGATCPLNGTGDVTGSAPNLGTLAANGGFTPTHLPNVGSPVIGTGNPACAGTDQRGLPRPQSGTCDKGAVDR